MSTEPGHCAIDLLISIDRVKLHLHDEVQTSTTLVIASNLNFSMSADGEPIIRFT